MSASDDTYRPVTLTEAERALIWQHADRTSHDGYILAMKSKIMQTANDFNLWLQRNREWSHRDENVFFTRFGYMPRPDAEARLIYQGVRNLLDALEGFIQPNS